VTLRNEIIEVGGRRWKVREARSHEDALNTIAHARVSGSVGAKDILDETHCGGGVTVLGDVVVLNSDDTERQPYQAEY
jgi:hypothetical protein